jgi:hypothetical protein
LKELAGKSLLHNTQKLKQHLVMSNLIKWTLERRLLYNASKMPTFVFVGVEELIAPAFIIFKFKFEGFEKVPLHIP